MIRRVSVVAAFVAVACSDSGPTALPTTLAVVSGDEQVGTVGQALTNPITVRVVDSNGIGVGDVRVEFVVTSGNGSVTEAGIAGLGGASAASASAMEVVVTTNSAGEAQAAWTLGASSGEQEATASVQGLSDVTFSATAVPDDPATIDKVSGDAQMGLVGARLNEPLIVEVRDRLGNGVPGVNVLWSLPGTAGQTPDTTVTGPDGKASAVVVPGEVGEYEATAEVTAGIVTFTGTASEIALVFMRDQDDNEEIYLIDAGGTATVQFTHSPSRELHPAWSPDGTKIAFMSNRDGNREIYVMNLDGTGGALNLINHPAIDTEPCWSPDGRKIAFTSGRDGQQEIYVLEVATGAVANITNHQADEFLCDWSPDGSRIVFVSTRDGNWEIYTMNADGTDPQRLTSNSVPDGQRPVSDGDPAWSHDGSKIVFWSDRDGGPMDIYVMDADGTNLTRLTYDGASNDVPDWSPDGAKIAWGAWGASGWFEIYVMSPDGTNRVNLTKHPAHDNFPDWKPLKQE